MAVVFLVSRQLMIVAREEMVAVVMAEESGETIIKDVETVLDDQEKTFL